MKLLLFVIALFAHNLVQAQADISLKFELHLDTYVYYKDQSYQLQNNLLIHHYDKSYVRNNHPDESKTDSVVLDSQQIQQIIDFLKKEKENLSDYALCRARTSLHIDLKIKIGNEHYLDNTYAPCQSTGVPSAFRELQLLLDGMKN